VETPFDAADSVAGAERSSAISAEDEFSVVSYQSRKTFFAGN
jgi:hypothetical protein